MHLLFVLAIAVAFFIISAKLAYDAKIRLEDAHEAHMESGRRSLKAREDADVRIESAAHSRVLLAALNEAEERYIATGYVWIQMRWHQAMSQIMFTASAAALGCILYTTAYETLYVPSLESDCQCSVTPDQRIAPFFDLRTIFIK